MPDASGPPARESRGGAILVAAAVGVSAVGVLGWHLLQNRGDDRERLDVSGFDLAAAPTGTRPVLPLPAPADAPAPASSLGMLKADEGVRVVESNASSDSSPSQAANKARKQQEAGQSFQQLAKKHEKKVRSYFMKATAKYPSVRQYGRDWMSYPDLKKLNDDYFRDRDPVKFMKGVAKSENFGKLVKKYSTDPAIRAVVIDAAKQAPSDLMAAGLDYLNEDRVIKDLVGTVAKGMGLPSSLMAIFDDGKGAKVDQNQVMSDIMKNNPEARKAMEGQQQNQGIRIGR
ncbi:MAG: hypothetical protein SF051_16445 [Elusimicrobiota bacterium]|nr:hypothetical protein [Elusimicrobiota bacterium]